jgi:predicted nuclease of predicted toxin-antitoxin system
MKSAELKFLIDVGVGGGIEIYLREEGYDTKAVREIEPQMEDEEIIRLAVSENRMVVTMDKDFGELAYRSSMKHSGGSVAEA